MAKDHLIRTAIRIHRQLTATLQGASPDWDKSVKELLQWAVAVQKQFNLAKTAADRGWHAAAVEKENHGLADLRLLESAIARLRHQNPPSRTLSSGPALRSIVEDLRQLKVEFEDCEIDLKLGLVGATTEPIELHGIFLGPFSIELHINRLADRLDPDCFKVIALEPNPAGSNSDTVHPHVQGNHLCAGDATVPISLALKHGRIADAFMLIRSVLMSYNPDSPYVSLDNWDGRTCEECGCSTDSDSMYYCEGCEHDVCEDCYSSCDVCMEGCCRACLERDNVSDKFCCTGCRRYCSACNRTVDEESFDDDTDLCPDCVENVNKQEIQNELVQCSADNTTDTTCETIHAHLPAPATASYAAGLLPHRLA